MTDDTKNDPTAKLGRRKFLKGSAGALPLLATIPSGASATARSSNYIGYLQYGDSDANYSDSNHHIRCLYADSVKSWHPTEPRAELYSNPEGYKLRADYNYTREPDKYAKKYNADYVCDKGGEFYVKVDGKWHKVKVDGKYNLPKNGIIVSATAMQSFGGGYFDVAKLYKL